MAKDDEGVFAIQGFRGLRNTVAEDQLEVGELAEAQNFDLLDSGDIASRKGNSPVRDATASHSLWARGSLCLVVQGTTLYQLKPDYTKVALRTGLTAGLTMAYEFNAGRVYYTNGAQRGVIENFASRTLGLEVPALPRAAAYPGTLPPGRYQFALTYLRNDGQESGARAAGSITLTAVAGGIQFTEIPVPTDASVAAKWLYLTKVNSEVLYRYATLAPAATTMLAVEEHPGVADLKTMHLGPPPDGTLLGWFNGRLLVVSGNAVYPSEPYAPELFDLRKRYALLDPIVTVACMTDGVHCGTATQNVFLAGRTPEEWVYQETADYGAIAGSLAWVAGSQLGKGEQSGTKALLMTERGICLLGDGGEFRNLTETKFAYPIGERGAGLVRRHGGMNQYIGVMRGVTSAGNSHN